MFQAKIKAEYLKELYDVVQHIVDEIKITITPSGLQIRAVDPSHVALVDLNLKVEAFEEYKADNTEVCIDVEKLNQVLKLSKGDDIVSITHDPQINRLILVIDKLTMKMSLLDMKGITDPKVPSLNYTTSVKVPVSSLLYGIKAADTVGEHISIAATKNGLEITCEENTESVRVDIPASDLKEMKFGGEDVKSYFSLHYISSMVRAIGSASEATLYIETDYPLKIEFPIAEGKGSVTYLLAPRIENEND